MFSINPIFSFGQRWNVPFNSITASLNETFRLSPHKNIPIIMFIYTDYLYTVCETNWYSQKL